MNRTLSTTLLGLAAFLPACVQKPVIGTPFIKAHDPKAWLTTHSAANNLELGGGGRARSATHLESHRDFDCELSGPAEALAKVPAAYKAYVEAELESLGIQTGEGSSKGDGFTFRYTVGADHGFVRLRFETTDRKTLRIDELLYEHR